MPRTRDIAYLRNWLRAEWEYDKAHGLLEEIEPELPPLKPPAEDELHPIASTNERQENQW